MIATEQQATPLPDTEKRRLRWKSYVVAEVEARVAEAVAVGLNTHFRSILGCSDQGENVRNGERVNYDRH